MKTKENIFKKGKLKFEKSTLLELNQKSLIELNGGGFDNPPTGCTLSKISSAICGHVDQM